MFVLRCVNENDLIPACISCFNVLMTMAMVEVYENLADKLTKHTL